MPILTATRGILPAAQRRLEIVWPPFATRTVLRSRSAALQTLASRRILSAPVLSDDNEICGFLDIRDILSSFLDGARAAPACHLTSSWV